MYYDGNELNGGQVIVNAFASFFQSSYCPSQNKDVTINNLKTNNVFVLPHVSEDDVIKSIRKLKPKMTMGPDNIPAFMIKDCASVFAGPLTVLFNLILTTGNFPTSWKVSRLCPIFKNGERDDISNYRPIIIINNFCKVLENILHHYIYNHVKNIISINQHGFMSARSTTTNLVCVTQFISNIVDNHGQVDVVYTDFSKAFDRLDHNILIKRLEEYGMSADILKLFSSYLSNRIQYVQHRGFKSDATEVLSGVPQGSVLGPLLFNIFLDDIVCSVDVDLLMYADDMKLYAKIDSYEDCNRLQHALNNINKWCGINNLPLNTKKCNAMSFTRRANPLAFDYQINDHCLSRPPFIKDLGIIFDSELSFVEHINEISKKSYKMLGFVLRNCKDFASTDTIILLYNSLVRSRLEYASIVWSPLYESHKITLENVQRRFLKFIYFKENGLYPPIGFPHAVLLNMFNCESLEHRRSKSSIIFLFNIINNIFDCPALLQHLHLNVPRLESRLPITFRLPIPHTNLLKASPLFQACSNYIKLGNTIDIFNCTVKQIKEKILNDT